MNVLMSIHPEWAEKIYSGEKTLEYRKSYPYYLIPETDRIILYETLPVMKITGEIEISAESSAGYNACCDCFPGNVDTRRGCVDLEDIDAYWCKGNGMLYVLRITRAEKYAVPLQLSDYGLRRPPQSWMYLYDKPHKKPEQTKLL